MLLTSCSPSEAVGMLWPLLCKLSVSSWPGVQKLCAPFPLLCEILARPLGLEALKASLLPNSLHWVGPKENSVVRSWCSAKLTLGIGGNSFLCLDFLCRKHHLIMKWKIILFFLLFKEGNPATEINPATSMWLRNSLCATFSLSLLWPKLKEAPQFQTFCWISWLFKMKQNF